MLGGSTTSLNRSLKPFVLKGGTFLSDWFFLWVIPLIVRTRRTAKASLELFSRHTSDYNGKRLEKYWQAEVELANKESRYDDGNAIVPRTET